MEAEVLSTLQQGTFPSIQVQEWSSDNVWIDPVLRCSRENGVTKRRGENNTDGTFFFFLLFKATPAAYGSQARGQIRLPAYATATAMPDLSRVCDLHHRSCQRQIPNPLGKARDGNHVFIDTSWIHFHCTTTGTPNTEGIFFNCFPKSLSIQWYKRPLV